MSQVYSTGRFFRRALPVNADLSLFSAQKDLTVRPKRWIRASLLAALAASPLVYNFASASVAWAAEDVSSIEQLQQIITNRNSTPTQRDDAALLLVNRNSPATSPAVVGILRMDDVQPAQLSIVKAISQADNPDASFIPELTRLLGNKPTLTSAAAEALTNYAGNFESHPEVLDALTNFSANQGIAMSIRAEVLRKIGLIVQQKAAGFLVRQLSVANQAPALQTGAADGLAEMTGIQNFTSKQWSQWWATEQGKSPAEFRSDVLVTRERQSKRAKLHALQVIQATNGHLSDDYAELLTLNPVSAQKALLGYLNDRTPEIRAVGVERVYFFWSNPKAFTEPVRQKLLSMISDPDADVRLKVVTTLLTINDRLAGKPLIDQLSVEKDLRIKIRIAQTLAKLEEPAATAALLNLLHDPQPDAVAASAKALSGNLGSNLRQSDPSAADRASADIRKIVDGLGDGAGNDEVRAACVGALAALGDKASFNLFMKMVQPALPSEVRRAALTGLGNLGDTNADSVVAEQLKDKDRLVRLKAAEALQTTATPGQTQFIFDQMKHNPDKDDPEKDISDALWVALQNLYAKQSVKALQFWSDALRDAPDKRLYTLQKMGEKLAESNDAAGVADNQQTIADAMMAVKPPQTLSAIDNLQKALAYWRGPGKGEPDKLEAIISAIIDNQLLAGRYSDATTFAAQQIQLSPVYNDTVGSRIKAKIEELSDKNPADAKVLIDEALKMNPPLASKYLLQIKHVQELMKQVVPPG